MKVGYVILLFLIFVYSLSAQDNSSYIYGTIRTDSDEEYTGYMRWGKEEMYWHDVFNSIKRKGFKGGKKSQYPNMRNDIDWSLKSIWKDNYCTSCNSNHAFACLFGDIADIKIINDSRAELLFKNGSTIEVNGGSNDLGTTIHMTDYELGKIRFDWDDIEQITFKEAPSTAIHPYGTTLYGTVKTERHKKIVGYIKWDLDERNGKDIMNGESKYGDQKIPFENIKHIEKIRNGDGVKLTMVSGRTIEIDGSNDCDDGNRGIAIYAQEVGNIEVSWSDFKALTFMKPPDVVISYSDFKGGNGINATVRTFDNNSVEGHIAYDKDELWGFEFIDGDDDDIKYQIPIRNIKKISPKNRSFSSIELKNGDALLLGEKQDVNSDNNGVLLLKQEHDQSPKTIEWKNILEVIFK